MVDAILWLYDRIAPLIRLAGADYTQFRAILQTKLVLDNRRQSATVRSRRREPRHMFLFTMMFYAFMGMFPGVALITISSPLTGLTLLYSIVMLLMGMSLVADFTGVLIDNTDLSVLGPRPVSGRTNLAARLAHICTYLGSLGLALAAVSFVTGTFSYGLWFPLVHLAMLFCAVVLVVFIVNLFYLSALHFVDVERFKDLIVYFQIAMFVLMIAGYQVMPRLMDVRHLQQLDLGGRWWTYLYPPCWFGGTAEWLLSQRSPALLPLVVQSVVIPVGGLVVVVRYLAPRFGRSLSAMGGEVSEAGPTARMPLRSLLGGLVARNPEQRAGFDLVWTMAARDRQFKARVYIQIAMIFIWPLIMLLASRHGPAHMLTNLEPKQYLVVLYLSAFAFPAALFAMQYSNQFEAAWIYYALPLRSPGQLMVGVFKAMACRFGIVTFGVFAVVLGVLVGPSVLPCVALALFLNGTVAIVTSFLIVRRLPFSENVSTLQSGGRFAATLPLLVLPGGAGFGHYLLTHVPHAVPLAILPAAGLFAVLLWIYGRQNWSRFGLAAA